MPGRLTAEIGALLAQHVLTQDQAARLLDAAEADRAGPGGAPAAEQRNAAGVLDVLGYVGGALLLGALIFLGFELWDDVGATGRSLLAVASAVLPAAGGLALLAARTRQVLAFVLLALACFAVAFAFHTIADDDSFIGTTAVLAGVSALGAALTRAPAFLLPGWVGTMGFGPAAMEERGWLDSDSTGPLLLAAAFLLVAALFAGVGVVMARRTAWTLAGLSGWAASVPLLVRESDGAYLCLLVASLVAAALFVAFVRQPAGAVYAVVGCLIVLSMWPIALFRILDSALGVAAGLVAAGGVLISVTVVLARLRKKQSDTN